MDAAIMQSNVQEENLAVKNPASADFSVRRHPTQRGWYRLTARIWLPVSRERIFEFFSDAFQLESITPPWLSFRVLSTAPIEMRVGTRIDYRLRVHGLPLRWQSEITVWEPLQRFVDVQRRGPYRQWIHEHTFRAERGGTWVEDHVDYAVWGGAVVNRLFVQKDVERIFRFRRQRLGEVFGVDLDAPE